MAMPCSGGCDQFEDTHILADRGQYSHWGFSLPCNRGWDAWIVERGVGDDVPCTGGPGCGGGLPQDGVAGGDDGVGIRQSRWHVLLVRERGHHKHTLDAVRKINWQATQTPQNTYGHDGVDSASDDQVAQGPLDFCLSGDEGLTQCL
ncbi:hypothetical protein M271_34420 [Streptomyces rapamycinicus NRRL 5491]|nr:hypothetical protein M271_34420 [Streptomyces rapamycinicus NRRL 5491]